MSSQVVTFEAPEELIATVDEIASKHSVDREAILRDALTEYVADYEDLKADLVEGERQIAAGETVPHEEVVAWFNARWAEHDKSEAA